MHKHAVTLPQVRICLKVVFCTLIARGKSNLADIGNDRVATTVLGCQVSSQPVDQPTADCEDLTRALARVRVVK